MLKTRIVYSTGFNTQRIDPFEKLSTKRQIEFLAGRFACKEAFSKAWGTGIGKVGLQDIEVLTEKQVHHT